MIGNRLRRGSDGGSQQRTVDADVGLHTSVAVVVSGETQLAVKHRQSRSAARRSVDEHVVGFAGSQENFALDAGRSGKRIAVFRDEREAGSWARASLRADNGRNVHAETGVHEANQHCSGRSRRSRDSWIRGEFRAGARALIQRHTVYQIVTRIVVHDRRIASSRAIARAGARKKHTRNRRSTRSTAACNGHIRI